MHLCNSHYRRTIEGCWELGTKVDDSRVVLLKAARKLFASRGYKATTVRDIAQEAKLNLSLVSYYFGGKEGLFKACVREVFSARMDTALETLVEPSSQEEMIGTLTMFVDRFLDSVSMDPDGYRLALIQFEKGSELRSYMKKQIEDQLFSALVQFFNKADARSFLRPGSDPRSIAAVFYSFLVNSSNIMDLCSGSSAVAGDRTPSQSFAGTFQNIFLDGILNKSA